MFPSPAGISLTKLLLAGNNLNIANHFLSFFQCTASTFSIIQQHITKAVTIRAELEVKDDSYRLSHQKNNVVSDFGHSDRALDEIC
jgi:hypothetical protein